MCAKIRRIQTTLSADITVVLVLPTTNAVWLLPTGVWPERAMYGMGQSPKQFLTFTEFRTHTPYTNTVRATATIGRGCNLRVTPCFCWNNSDFAHKKKLVNVQRPDCPRLHWRRSFCIREGANCEVRSVRMWKIRFHEQDRKSINFAPFPQETNR